MTRFHVLGLTWASSLVASSFGATFDTTAQQGQQFGLFAYGKGIGGLPVFFNDGLAFITDFATANTTAMVPVLFTFDSNTNFNASPNPDAPVRNNATDNPGFQNATFGLPTAGPVRFGTNGTSDSDETTTGFGFMGHVVFNKGSDGLLNGLFFAEPTETENIWALVWNQGGDGGAVPVTLKDQPPPNLRQ